MINISESKSKSILYFLVIEGTLYLSFLIGDLLKLPTDGLKYLAICLCAGFAMLRTRETHDLFVPAALALTIAADACLLYGIEYLPGVLFFCGVQALYAARLMWWRGRLRQFVWQDHMQSVAWRVFLYVVSLVALRLISDAAGTDLVTALSGAALRSFGQLTVSVVEAWHLCRFEPRTRTFAVGLSLFWVGDLCVGLHYVMRGALLVPYDPLVVYDPLVAYDSLVVYGIWFFYLPAQVCIALSEIEEGPTRVHT